jgi:hypothetical protein
MTKMNRNPSNATGKLPERADRIPMNSPQRKLEVPPIDGYTMYWFRGDPGRLQRAQRAGYEFVRPEEVELNNFDLAGDPSAPGQTDMGDRVSVAAQDGADGNGQFLRLYLMKIKNEYREQDQERYERERIDPIVNALAGGRLGSGEGGEHPGDIPLRYQKPFQLPKMFTKKTRVAA